jgi:hypothetical protein
MGGKKKLKKAALDKKNTKKRMCVGMLGCVFVGTCRQTQTQTQTQVYLTSAYLAQ